LVGKTRQEEPNDSSFHAGMRHNLQNYFFSCLSVQPVYGGLSVHTGSFRRNNCGVEFQGLQFEISRELTNIGDRVCEPSGACLFRASVASSPFAGVAPGKV
jgi:hypothetical protein